MTAPATTGEIKAELLESAYHGYGFLAELIQQWRAEWLRDAEPRRRLTSETPSVGDLIVHKFRDGSFGDPFRYHEFSSMKVPVGWILLERAKPKTLAEEARELLARPMPEEADWREVFVFLTDAKNLLRRVAGEKSDE